MGKNAAEEYRRRKGERFHFPDKRTPSCMHAWAMQRDDMARKHECTAVAARSPYVHDHVRPQSPWINRAKRAPHAPMLPPYGIRAYGPHVHVPRAQSMRRAPRDMSWQVRVRTSTTAPLLPQKEKGARTILCTYPDPHVRTCTVHVLAARVLKERSYEFFFCHLFFLKE